MWQRVAEAGRALARGLVDLVYPPACLLCGRPPPPADGDPAGRADEDAGPFCASCRGALAGDPHPACPRCAATVGPFARVEGGCNVCRGDAFAFERAVRLGPYDGLLRAVVLRLKHATGEGLAEVMGVL